MKLTSEQVAIIGLAATLLVTVFRLALNYVQKTRVKIDKRVMVALVYLVALALSYLFAPASFPTFPIFGADALAQDVLAGVTAWLINFLSAALAQFGFATFVYKVLLEKIEEQMDKRLLE